MHIFVDTNVVRYFMIKNTFKTNYSILLTFILFINSFMPIIYFISLGLNGFFIYLLHNVTNIKIEKLSLIINPTLSILFCFLYYYSNNFIKQIIYSFATIIFLVSTVYSMKIELYGNEEGKFYYLPFLISTIIIGTLLISIDTFKIKQRTT